MEKVTEQAARDKGKTMRVHDVRPAAGELTYQLYSRALHPELFEVRATRILAQPAYVLLLRICEAGHLVEVRWKGETITEVNCDGKRDLTHRGRCLSTKVAGARDVEAHPLPGVSFQASMQLEKLDTEVFERVTQEFQNDRKDATVSHVFGTRNRLQPQAVSLVFADCSPRSIVVHAFHSFPDDFAIVRTQSLYEFVESESSRAP
jgi:hypothetical protein